MICVLGSINLDLIANSERLPLPGETVLGTGFATAPGGKGANQALAASRAGASVIMAGAVGSDDFAVRALAGLKGAGVDLTRVHRHEGASGIAIIVVDKEGENVIIVIPGANAAIDAEMARATIGGMRKGDFLMMQQEIPAPAIGAALDQAQKEGITSILNIAPIIPQTRELALKADIIVANETEYAYLSGGQGGKTGNIAAHAAKWARRHDKIVIITLGEAGVIAVTPNARIKIAALAIKPLDSVGAGDTFCGYLAAGLAQGRELSASLERAAVAGSLACLKPGAQPAIPSCAQVDAAMPEREV